MAGTGYFEMYHSSEDVESKASALLHSAAFIRNICHSDIYRVMLEMCAQTLVGLHIKRPLFLSEFNGNWHMSTNFGRTYQFEIS
jgi:hypothetical protein